MTAGRCRVSGEGDDKAWGNPLCAAILAIRHNQHHVHYCGIDSDIRTRISPILIKLFDCREVQHVWPREMTRFGRAAITVAHVLPGYLWSTGHLPVIASPDLPHDCREVPKYQNHCHSGFTEHASCRKVQNLLVKGDDQVWANPWVQRS